MTSIVTRSLSHEDTETETEHQVKMEANIGMIHLQATECQGWQTIPRSQERGMERIPPQRPQKEPTMLILWFQTSDIQNHENTNLCCFEPPNFWHLVTGALGNEHHPTLWCYDSLLLSCLQLAFPNLLGGLTHLFQTFKSQFLQGQSQAISFFHTM